MPIKMQSLSQWSLNFNAFTVFVFNVCSFVINKSLSVAFKKCTFVWKVNFELTRRLTYLMILSVLWRMRSVEFITTISRQLQRNKNLIDCFSSKKQDQKKLFIEFSASPVKNIVSKEDDERSKYQNLLFKLCKFYATFSIKLVVIIGALGSTKVSLIENLNFKFSDDHYIQLRLESKK